MKLILSAKIRIFLCEIKKCPDPEPESFTFIGYEIKRILFGEVDGHNDNIGYFVELPGHVAQPVLILTDQDQVFAFGCQHPGHFIAHIGGGAGN